MTPREEQARNSLQNIAETIEEKLPKGFGFTLLAYEFDTYIDNKNNKMLYISNSNRQQIIMAMTEWIEKTENNFGEDV